ncbi:LPXTG cell wall anchor domain-containing protein OS=Streptomyces alboniger OX=132473 GN=CP975_03880 PE=4 SV=1 [Streptomyces alboniger]
MRTTQICVRAGLAVAAAALPSALGATAAVAAGDLTVSATGSTVRVTTAACPDGGTASLMDKGDASFAGGRQVALAKGSGSWQNVAAGSYTVLVACKDGTQAGPRAVTVGGATPTSTPTASSAPTASSTTAPARGVRGGVGGGSQDRGTLTLAAGSTLVAAAAGAGLWYLRRRGARGRP